MLQLPCTADPPILLLPPPNSWKFLSPPNPAHFREQVTVLQEDGLLAEYVHILADSAFVTPGDQVTTGQPLCLSGGAGFCPTPHLHLQLQEGEGDTAPTVQFALLDCEGSPYFPVAGKWYGPQGEVPAPLITPLREGTVENTADIAGESGCGAACARNAPRVTSPSPPPSR